MPIITGPLRPNDNGQAVADLHKALLKYGAPIADVEKTGKRFGDSTLAAVLAFRSQHGLPPVAGTASPFDASVARLLNVASPAIEGNRTALRTALRESIAAADTASPQEQYWLAGSIRHHRRSLPAGSKGGSKSAAAEWSCHPNHRSASRSKDTIAAAA